MRWAAIRALVLSWAAWSACAGENWPQFRGPRGDGTSSEAVGAPLRVVWAAALPGPGHSSPVVWQDRIFVTAFERDRSFTGALLGRRGQILLLSLDRRTGKLIWRKHVPAGGIEKTSGVNQPASPTPATDGTRVFAYFGSYGLAAWDFDGRPLWENRIGPFPHHMGSGSSPMLARDRVLLNVESDGPSFLYAIDRLSGRTVWRVPRRTRQAGYSSAVPWGGDVIVAGSERLAAYNGSDGAEHWGVDGLSTYVIPTPIASAGLMYATSSGPGGSVVLAIKPNGEVAWRAGRGASYVASPVVHGGRLYTVNNNCVVSCLDASGGQLLWQKRLPGQGECYASPVAAGGLMYIVANSGQVYTLGAGGQFVVRSTLDLREAVLASPAISGGLMFVRSDRHLFALGRR